MDRVWKRFFGKISKGIAVLTYALTVMIVPAFVAHWLGYHPQLGVLIGAGVGLFLPMIVFILRDTYKDAKREIEWENRKLMSDLGKKY